MKYKNFQDYFMKSYEKQLKIGTKIEMEHSDTFDKIAKRKLNKKKKLKMAEMIAKDHIEEMDDYYTKLVKMEKEGKSHDN